MQNVSAERADFTGADLRGANLDNLCCKGCLWANAKLDERCMRFSPCSARDLSPVKTCVDMISAMCA